MSSRAIKYTELELDLHIKMTIDFAACDINDVRKLLTFKDG